MSTVQTFSEKDYPGLNQAADRESLRSQRIYFRCLSWYLYFLILGAVVNLFSGDSKYVALFATVLFLGSLALLILIAVKRYDRTWYSARAVAESVKTRTWRYMMRTEPYHANMEESEARNIFLCDLKEILEENRDVTKELCDETASEDAVSPAMTAARALDMQSRLSFYMNNRVQEQGNWYQQKAIKNKEEGSKWFFYLMALNGFAIICSLLRVAFLDWSYLPTGVFAVAAASVLSWMQARRFTELSTSYALTAHEITIIRGRAPSVSSEESLSQFVSDTENAFSREHTQWAARRDAACRIRETR